MNKPLSIYPKRIFDWEAQNAFATFSGDLNPMHMDAVAARRTQAGQPVVHGMHALLWALDTLAQQQVLLHPPAQIKVRLQKLIYVGDELALEIMRRDDAAIAIQLSVQGTVVITITISFGEIKAAAAPIKPCEAIPSPFWPKQPLELSLEQMHSMHGCLSFAQSPDTAASLFPSAVTVIGAHRVAGIACLSRLVGMVCPGLHSIYTGLTLQSVEPHTEQDFICYQVTNAYELFRKVRQTVEGAGWIGVVESFARIPPVSQLTVQEVTHYVLPDEFKQTSALIIGGSRGLGELTAKLIAAGGGTVAITYAVGRTEALQIQEQILQSGGRCEILQYDATKPAAEQLDNLSITPSSLYYFATNPIFLRKTSLYAPLVFEKFYRIYVDAFFEACMTIKSASNTALSAFYPSSVAVQDRPSDMTEYAMAKSAGEVLCADMARFLKDFRVVVERLPRMLTDQTTSLVPIETVAPVDVMLPIVRRMESRS